jgi:hypothetical protein
MSRGAIEGGVGTLLVEPITLAVAREKKANYGLSEAMTTVLGGTVLGGPLRAVGGKLLGDKAGLTSFSGDVAKILPFKDNVRLFQSAIYDVEHGRAPVLAQAILNKMESDSVKAVDSIDSVGNISLSDGEALAGIEIDLDAVKAFLSEAAESGSTKTPKTSNPVGELGSPSEALENAFAFLERKTSLLTPEEKTQFFNEIVAEAVKTLKPHQIDNLQTHQGGSLGDTVQKVLAMGKDGNYEAALKKVIPNNKNFRDNVDSFIKIMDETIQAHGLSKAVKLWRGQIMAKDVIDGLLKQISVFKESGSFLKLKMNTYLGASLKEKTGAEFWESSKYAESPDKRAVLFSINVPEGTKAAVPQAGSTSPKYGTFAHEQEFILARDTTLLIRNIEEVKNYTVGGKNFGTVYKVSAHIVPEGNKSSLASASIKDTDNALKRLLDLGYTKQDILDEPLILDIALSLKDSDLADIKIALDYGAGVNKNLEDLVMAVGATPEQIKMIVEINAKYPSDKQMELVAFAAADCLGKA